MIKSKAKRPLYTTCEVPAKIFFKVFSTGDYTLLGDGTPQKQEAAFYSIFDEYCLIEENERLVEAYHKQARIQVLLLQIETIDLLLLRMKNLKLTKQAIQEHIDALNSIDNAYVKFDNKKDIIKEIERVEVKVLGRLRNEVNFESDGVKQIKESAPYEFEQTLIDLRIGFAMASAPVNIDSDLTLAEYASFHKRYKELTAKKPKNNG